MKFQVLAVLAAITLASAPASAPATSAIEKVDVPGVKNFSRFDGPPGFAGSPVGFGGATQPTVMPWLRSEGFATVINLRLATEEGADVDSSRAAAQAAGLNYIHLPFDAKNPDPDVVEDFLTAASDKANQPVYIYCNSATRVATLWMIGRVLKEGWDIDAGAEEAEVIALKPSEAVAFATMYITSRGK
ncbi:MAG: hypothetical protein E4H01_06720 [Lysobacterales bacterium]|nr:MAG: hypothetical protein E4H01_06720 [Xanthomonadales bacterium]